FLANYAATALTETLEIFFTSLALDLAVSGLGIDRVSGRDSTLVWLGCGFSVGGAILLRPDGGLLLVAIGGYLLWKFLRSILWWHASVPGASGRWILAGVLVAVGATLPLVPWTLRNLHTLHRFQPLAPRYANDSDELVMNGFNRWVKTF